jgi:U3 small nucleolar RNA-associated protein 21
MTEVAPVVELPCFGPFRPVGVVCGSVTAAATELYGEPMLLVPIRRTFQLYKGETLSLVRGGPEYENDISCAAQAGKLRYVAEGHTVHAMSHHKTLWSKAHNAVLKSAVVGLVAIDDLLFSFGEDGKCCVFGGRTGELVTSFTLNLPPRVRFTCAVIPPHYKNKLLVGCSDGRLRLYNFSTARLLHTWNPPASDDAVTNHAAGPSITCLAASAYKGLVAIGMSDARAFVYHFEEDAVLAQFTHDSSRSARVEASRDADEGVMRGGASKKHRRQASAVVESLRPATDAGGPAPITAVAFRTDNQGRTLATGNALGEVAFWDLQEQCLAGIVSGSKQVRSYDELLSNPHRDAVHTLFFIPGKPLLVSCGADNAMVEYRLDTVDGLALAIRERRGHTGRCTAATFYNDELIVTAGEDRAVRVTHVFSDRAAWELSQGKLGRRARDQGVSRDTLRLPAATHLVCTPARNYQWASIVSTHDCSAKVCGWRLDTRALEHKLEPIRTTAHTATAVAVSECGNFAVVGYSSGHVTRVNLQDQTLLHFYAGGADAIEGKHGDRAHPDAGKITAIHVFQWADLVATCAANGSVRTWRLSTAEPLAVLKIDSPVTCVAGHGPSLLLCAGCADCSIRVISLTDGRDMLNTVVAGGSSKASATIVRKLTGHTAALTAIALSPDSMRHLVTTGSDGSLMAWDLAAAQCIAQYRLPSPATSVCFHPKSLFLCTTHAGESGAVLWTNRLRYGHAPEAVTPKANIFECPLLHFPRQTGDTEGASTAKEDGKQQGDGEDGEEEEKDATTTVPRKSKKSTVTLPPDASQAEGLIRLSGFGVDYWESMAKLDQIRERNEPLLPPKKAAVPFFLPTTSELKPTFIVQEGAKPTNPAKGDNARFAHFSTEATHSEFTQFLIKEDYDGALAWMNTASASLIDLRLKSILKDDEADDETGMVFEQNDRAVLVVLKFTAHAIRSLRYFDMVQAYVKLLFQSHGELIAAHPNAVPLLEAVADAQREARQHLVASFSRVNCLSATFANAFA